MRAGAGANPNAARVALAAQHPPAVWAWPPWRRTNHIHTLAQTPTTLPCCACDPQATPPPLFHSPTYSLPAPLKGILVDTSDTNTATCEGDGRAEWGVAKVAAPR